MSLKERLRRRPRLVKPVECPDGETLFVRRMTGAERAAWSQHTRQQAKEIAAAADAGAEPSAEQSGAFVLSLLASCLCDEQGNSDLALADAGEILQLLDDDTMKRAAIVAFELNAIGPAAEAAAEKKLMTPSGDSGNGSPAPEATPTPTSC